MSEPVSNERLEELLELEAKATPGPWKPDEQNEFNDYCVWGPKHDGLCGEDGFIANVDNGDNLAAAFDLSCDNAALIAESRNSIRAIILELRDRRKREGELLAAVEKYAPCADDCALSNYHRTVLGVAEMSKKLDIFMQQHRDEIRAYQEFNQRMMAEMKKLVEHVVSDRVSTVVLRALPREEAKQEVLNLFRSATGPLFYSDIAERLQMDLEQVLDVTTELEREGLIGEQGNPNGPIKQ